MYTVNSIQQWDELERLSISEKSPTPPPKYIDLKNYKVWFRKLGKKHIVITNDVTGEVYHEPTTAPTRKKHILCKTHTP